MLSNATRLIEQLPDELAPYGIRVPDDVLLARILDDEDTRELAAGAALIHDDHNQLQSESPRLGARRMNAGGAGFLYERDAHADRGWTRESTFYAMRHGSRNQAARLAKGLKDPVDLAVAGAILAAQAGKPRAAGAALDEVLQTAPRHGEARASRLRLALAEIRRGGDPEAFVEPPLSDVERAVTSGWIAEGARNEEALRSLEPMLTSVPLLDPLYAEAARLRMEWRIASGDPERARQAMQLAELESWGQLDPHFELVRARAAVAAGEWLSALDALDELGRRLRGGGAPRARSLAPAGLLLLDRVPNDPAFEVWRRTIRQALAVRPR
jgi:hypothetical protein